MKYSSEQKYKIIFYRDEGFSIRKISKYTSVPLSTISRIIKKYRTTGSLQHKGGNGRPHKLDSSAVDYIKSIIKENPKTSLRKIGGKLEQELDVKVVPSTVRKELNNINLFAYSPLKKPLLSMVNIQKRFKITKSIIKMQESDVKRIIFSDESKFNLRYSDGRISIWREPGTALNKNNLELTVKHNGPSVMVWACFSYEGIGNIEIIENTMTGASYVDILSRNLKASAQKMQLDNFIFQQDNDPKHTSRIAKEFFCENGINVLEWPPQSPDLNPIEHLWAHIKRNVGKKQPKNRNELIKLIKDEWSKISRDTCNKYALSFKKRALDIFKAKGKHVKY